MACRPLNADELGFSAVRLLDEYIDNTVRWTEAIGNRILDVGRTEPMTGDAPAFAAVALSHDDSLLMTVRRSVESERTCVVTTLTDNLQGSKELMTRVTEIVGSLEFL